MQDEASPLLELRGITRRYGDAVAVDRIDLDLPAGRTTALIGPSGCGKSTLLRMVVGLIPPDEGTIRFQGAAIRPTAELPFRRRLGYVIQEGGLFPHLTARENVVIVARHLRWESARIEDRVAELADLARLPSSLLERYPLELSGGQRQRVSLMRALMLDPDLLLLDEPLAALDPMIRADLQEDLRRVFQSLGKTVLLVTHDVGEAGYFGDSIVLMRAGTIVQRGSLADLVERPAEPFVTRFLSAQRSPLTDLGGDGAA